MISFVSVSFVKDNFFFFYPIDSFSYLLIISVVSHDSASKDCKRKMAEAYALNQKQNGVVSEDELNSLRRKLDEDQNQDAKPKSKRQRQVTEWLKEK